MNMIPVSSSNLSSVGYDPITKTLFIRFVNGRTYSYSNVPEGIYCGLMQADSKGKYHAAHIKYSYPYKQIF